MQNRNLFSVLESLALSRNKMVFLSGPRQAGKTTLAKEFLKDKNCYFTWEDIRFRKKWIRSPIDFAESLLSESEPLVVLDEIHKHPKWKNQLKGVYDIYGDKIKIIVTGSALFNIFRKGSDSLMGRFFHFHLHPLSFGELQSEIPLAFLEFLQSVTDFTFPTSNSGDSTVQKDLFRWGGFPEPFLAKSDEIHQIWTKNRLELLIRQDLRDISQFLNHNQIEVLASVLPEKVGSLLSIASLREDLDVAHTTITRWMNALGSIYYHFTVQPYSHKILRSLKKEGKIYLYDWSSVEDEGARFENMVGSHLLKLVHFYNDTGQASLHLSYLRNKEKQEVDFILLNKKKPVLTIEVKLSDYNLDKTFLKFQKILKIPHIQIIQPEGVLRKFKELDACVVSFDRFFKKLP
jgi:predicted AAA+ superfamily ATPase